MPTLVLGNEEIQYMILRGSSRKYVYFRFRPDLTLEIISPRRGNFSLEWLLRGKEGWILRKYEQIRKNRRTLGGESLMFNGMSLRLVFVRSPDREELEVDATAGEARYWADEPSRIRELLRRFYIRETSRYVVSRLSTLAGEMGVRFRSADVREIKNWGYCTRGGRISISWQLISLPERLREYVLKHELVHLSEFNHSANFYRRLRSVCGDYRQRERELDEIEAVSLSSPASWRDEDDERYM